MINNNFTKILKPVTKQLILDMIDEIDKVQDNIDEDLIELEEALELCGKIVYKLQNTELEDELTKYMASEAIINQEKLKTKLTEWLQAEEWETIQSALNRLNLDKGYYIVDEDYIRNLDYFDLVNLIDDLKTVFIERLYKF